MKIPLLGALLLALLPTFALSAAPDAPKIKVLIVTGGHGFKAEPFFQIFRDNPAITYAWAKQDKAAEAYDRDDLYTYDVVLLYDAPEHITEAQKVRFLGLFDRGIGVIVLHHAYLSYPLWPEYRRIAGGEYVYRDGQVKDGVTLSHYQGNVDIPLTIVDPRHPVTAGMHDFVLHDELYANMDMLSNFTPLLKSGDELIAWARTEKSSRLVGTIVGHSCYQDPNFRLFLAQSIRWVAKR